MHVLQLWGQVLIVVLNVRLAPKSPAFHVKTPADALIGWSTQWTQWTQWTDIRRPTRRPNPAFYTPHHSYLLAGYLNTEDPFCMKRHDMTKEYGRI